MIPFDFDYYKPDTLEEAINLYKVLMGQEKKPIYYGGGTEIITLSRAFDIDTKAIIDIKGIPECRVHDLIDDELIIGSAITLTEITEKNLFPLLTLAAKRIADHTIQGKITLGGNICGTIIYNETVLPLMVSNSDVIIAGFEGIKQVPIMDLFQNGIQLKTGDLIIQTVTNSKYLHLPHLHAKRTRNDKIGYPLISLSALNDQGTINIAFSGVCPFPFREKDIENIINKDSFEMKEVYEKIPGELLNDLEGSSTFRKVMLDKMIRQGIKELKDVTI